MLREQEQMLTLARIERQGLRKLVEKRIRHADVAALLEPRAPVDADAGELRQLFASQSGAATVIRSGTSGRWRRALSAASDELRQGFSFG